METTTKTPTRSTSSPKSERTASGSSSENVDIREAFDDASSALQTLYTHASDVLHTTVRDRPYTALATAAGLGFVLGGGLRSVTGRFLLRNAAQLLIPAALASLQGDADE
jgi:ElaB/YqjD/DUF883 family membrane-anchored ribosome-binding protein